MGLPIGLLHIIAGFPQSKWSERERDQDRNNNVFNTPISEANLLLILLYAIGQRSALVWQWEQTAYGYDYQEAKIIRAILETSHHIYGESVYVYFNSQNVRAYVSRTEKATNCLAQWAHNKSYHD